SVEKDEENDSDDFLSTDEDESEVSDEETLHYMEQMDQELSSTDVGKSFVKTNDHVNEDDDCSSEDHFKGVNTYEDLYHFSINNSDKFWGELAKSRLDWIKPFGKVSDCDMHAAKFRWFEGGKLNVSVNCAVSRTDKDIDLDLAMESASSTCPAEVMDSEDLLFMLYTSGSTGKPKGIVHTQAGYLLYASLTQKYVFDYRDGDVFGCVADIGWITGHSYVVYGPLANGATTVLFESIPTYPDPGRYWEVVERLGINQFYGAPTAIRLLLRYGDSFVKKYDRSSLRVLGSVGEPINHEAWSWYHNVVGEGRCDVVDTWWQTETGGIAITPRPSAPKAQIIPATPMRPFFGIQPAVVAPDGQDLPGASEGACCIARPWPGMARTIYGDHERFLDTYFRPYPGFYFSGDGARRDEDGYFHITGRMDDVINISGHRLGTAEIEDVLDEHPDVSEAAVVGIPHPVKGEEAFAFITVKENVGRDNAGLVKELQVLVRNQIASFAVPSTMMVTDALPKTRSGKIMRRILRKIAVGDVHDLGDTSTLADPSVVHSLSKTRLE
uniref:Propionate--CoA ligase n=1 Tax=Ciona savignyi TaxID=51511 RepID=H2YF71_CIOSA